MQPNVNTYARSPWTMQKKLPELVQNMIQ